MSTETYGSTSPLQRVAVKRFAASLHTDHLSPLLNKVRPYTLVPTESLVDLARQVYAVLAYEIPGDFVECGVWRGGASFLIATLLREAGVRDRKVWLFDSFEGIPAPEAIDGPAAIAWASDTQSPNYFNNLRVTLEDVQRSAADLGLSSYTEFVKGWFEDTLSLNRERIGPIAVLRIDCDWYASVRCCLDKLYDQVADGGFIVLDDYYAFDGCALATHEFLGRRGLTQRIESVVSEGKDNDWYHAAVFRKGVKTWFQARTELRWLHRTGQWQEDLASVIPQDETFVFVDDGQLAHEIMDGRPAVPFLEHDGQYWGPPPDDDSAIRELERLRRSGAHFIVFAWPAFWWLEYYTGLHEYLRQRYRRVLENERLVVYELRD